MNSRHFKMGFRVVFYREDERVIAHAIEFDLIGDGASRGEALQSLSEAIRIQVEFAMGSEDPATALFRQAPAEVVGMFASGRSAEGVLNIKIVEEGWEFEGEEYRDADVSDHEFACA